MIVAFDGTALGSSYDAVIHDLVAAVDLSTEDPGSYEFLHEYVLDAPLSGAVFDANFRRERVASWFAAFGSALSISFKLSAGTASFEGSLSDTDMSALDQSERWFEEYDVEHAGVSICVRKAPLLSPLRTALQTDIDILFLYESALAKRLALGRLQDLVTEGLLKDDHHTVVIVATGNGMLQSPLLTIAGLKGASARDFAVAPNATVTTRAWRRALSLRQTTCTWSAPLVSTSPDAFSVVAVRPGLPAVAAAMRYACSMLSLLQFAVTVRPQTSTTWEAVMAVPGNAHLQVTVVPGERTTPPAESSSDAAYRLYRWAFRAESYDKIDIVRDLIQQVVRTNRARQIEELVPLVPDLIETARANFKTLRRKAFEAYMQSRNEARAAIQQFVDATQQQLDKLRHDALDTTLKFSAALIAFFAANVLKPGLSTTLVVIGFVFGLIYLILAFLLQLLPLFAQHEDTRTRAEKAVNDLPELSQPERDKILQNLPSKEGWTPFAKWFAASCLIYGGWAIVLCVVLVLVLASGHSAGAQLPTATPTVAQTR